MVNQDKKVDDFVKQYSQYAIQHRNGTYEGKSRKTNSAYDKITKLYQILQHDSAMADTTLAILIHSNNLSIQSFAAAHCLGLKKFVEEAEKVLEDISHNRDYGILAFNAKMVLETWRKQGYLKF